MGGGKGGNSKGGKYGSKPESLASRFLHKGGGAGGKSKGGGKGKGDGSAGAKGKGGGKGKSGAKKGALYEEEWKSPGAEEWWEEEWADESKHEEWAEEAEWAEEGQSSTHVPSPQTSFVPGSVTGEAKGKGRGKKAKDADFVESELVEGEDWYFEDTLREVLDGDDSPRTANAKKARRHVVYPTMRMEEMATVIGDSMGSRYVGLVQRMRERIRDYEGRCDFAKAEHDRWILERHHLTETIEQWRNRAEEERDRALHTVTVGTNHNLNMSLIRKRNQASGNAMLKNLKVGAGGLDVDLAGLEQDVGRIEMNMAQSRLSWLQAWGPKLLKMMMPMRKDIGFISSHYGSACGTFFEFYSVMILSALITLLCYTPLLVCHLIDVGDPFSSFLGALALPTNLLYGSFYLTAANVNVKTWTTALEVTTNSEGQASLSVDVGPAVFEDHFYKCPVVYYTRDCRVSAVFAGTAISTRPLSPYHLFTSQWSSVPGTLNRDFVIYDSFEDLIMAAKPWKYCPGSATTEPLAGFPGECGPTGSVKNKWFALPSVSNVTGGATSVQLKVYSGTNCPVTNQQASITSLVKGNAIDQASERDLWLAFRYIGAIVCTALLRLLMVLTRWQATEAQFHIENLIDELSPVRWSRLVLAAWDFRLTEDKDRALWQSSLANQLRARLEEEAKLTQEDTRTRVQIYLLTLRRICGGFLNVCFILASWAAIAYATVYKSDISTYLQESTEFKFLGSLAATVGNLVPNLVVAACGMMLPQATKTLTLLEGWSTATRARHLIYRLYLGKVLNATVFVALNVELVYGKPLFSDRLLITRDCQVFRCAEDQATYTMSSLVLSEFAITILATPLSNVAVGYATHILSGAMKKQAPFVLPDFEIADFAVDIMYFQGLLWTVMLLSPGMAFITPLILFGHFYWLKFTLYRLTSRPFVAETTALSVTLQRCLCLSALLNAAVAVLVLITTVPHETGCGPFDAYQPPGMMLMEINFWGRDTLATIGTWIASNWGLLLVLVTAVTGLLAMRVGISVRTNRNVLEQMSHNSHRHVDALHKEMWRLSRQGELYKKRLEWLEQGRD